MRAASFEAVASATAPLDDAEFAWAASIRIDKLIINPDSAIVGQQTDDQAGGSDSRRRLSAPCAT